MNTERNTNLYTIEELGFWIDRYNHTSMSEFDNFSSSLNEPHISTVRKWIGPRQKIDFGLSAKRLLNAANFYQNTLETVNTISEGGGLDLTVLDMERVESLQWASKKTDSVKDSEDFDLFACMIDETALRIIIEYNPEDGKLYGWSAMPRFVMLRNITPEFDFKVFLS